MNIVHFRNLRMPRTTNLEQETPVCPQAHDVPESHNIFCEELGHLTTATWCSLLILSDTNKMTKNLLCAKEKVASVSASLQILD